MEKVFSVDTLPWQELRGLPGARGFEFKAMTNDSYTAAYSCELVRLGRRDHSVPHIEPWSHLLYILGGHGDITISEETTAVQSGTICPERAACFACHCHSGIAVLLERHVDMKKIKTATLVSATR